MDSQPPTRIQMTAYSLFWLASVALLPLLPWVFVESGSRPNFGIAFCVELTAQITASMVLASGIARQGNYRFKGGFTITSTITFMFLMLTSVFIDACFVLAGCKSHLIS